MDGIKQIDAEIGTLPLGADRAIIERDASRMKADAAELMPDVVELQGHLDSNVDGHYKGIIARDETEKEIKAAADRDAGDLAAAIGVDRDAFISRYDRAEPAAAALSDQWRKDELEDIQKNLSYRAATPVGTSEELAQAAYDDLHRNALQTYRKAERELEAHAVKKRELYRISKLMREGQTQDPNFEDQFRQKVNDTLHSVELRQIEMGQSEAFQHITNNADEQRAFSKRYLEAEMKDADGVRRQELATAVEKIDRSSDLALRQAERRDEKSRGLER